MNGTGQSSRIANCVSLNINIYPCILVYDKMLLLYVICVSKLLK